MKEFKAVLSNTKFKYLWYSQLLSQLTIQIMNFLIIVKLFETTGSTIATSFIWVAYALPAILIGPFAATWVDLVDKRLVLTISNIAQALVILFYAIFSSKYLFLSYVVVLFYSFFNQFYVPAEAAMLPKIVNKKDLPQANGLFFLTQQASIIVGFGLAGVLADLLGYKTTFIFSAGMLFLAFLSVNMLPGNSSKEEVAKKFEMGMMKFIDKTQEGYSFIRSRPGIWMPFILLIGLHVATSIITIMLPAISVEIVQINPKYSGLLIILPGGAGAVLSTLLTSKYLKRLRKKELIEKALLAMGLSLWVTIFLIPEVPIFIKPIVAAIMFFLIGASYVAMFVPAQTFLQESTPKHLMGRVFGNFWFLATIATIFPVLFSATITEVFGVKVMFFVVGALTIAAYLFSTKKGQAILQTNAEETVNVQ